MRRNSILYKLTEENENDLSCFGVYMITNKTNDKKYIGSTSMVRGFRCRWNNHCNDLKLNKHHSIHLQNHVNKYGIEDLNFSIIEILDDISICRKREKYWLDFYGFENTFNISKETDISIGGRSHPCYIPIDTNKVIELFNTGMHLSKMAKELNTTKYKIISELRRSGIGEDYMESLPLRQIYFRHVLGKETTTSLAKEYNVSRTALERRFRKHGYKNRFDIIDEYLDRAKKYTEQGGSWKSFCKKLPFDYISFVRRIDNEKADNICR